MTNRDLLGGRLWLNDTITARLNASSDDQTLNDAWALTHTPLFNLSSRPAGGDVFMSLLSAVRDHTPVPMREPK